MEGSAIANSQPLIDPFATALDVSQGVGIDAADARHGVGSLSAPSTGATYGFMSGVFPGGTSGPGMSNDLQVLPGGGLRSAVNAGGYAVERGSLGVYIGAATASITVDHEASNPSNPRIDLVVIRNREPITDGTVTESARIIVLKGEPASMPADPGGLTSGDLVLAAVTIRAGATSTAAGDYADRRLPVVARGGITPRPTFDNRPGSYEGQYRDNSAYKTLDRWSGAAWEPVAAPSAWEQWTPRLMCDGTGTDIGMGVGPLKIGRFQLVGRRLDFLYWFEWGAEPWHGGFGDVFTRLPLHPVTGQTMVGVGYSQWVQCHLWTENVHYTGDFAGQALLHANSNRITPFFGICHGHLPPKFPVNMNTDPYRIASQVGVPASGVPRIFNPDGWPQGGDLGINGSVEVRFL